MAGAEDEVADLANLLSAPIAVTYLHNDALPADHPLYAGPLGLFLSTLTYYLSEHLETQIMPFLEATEVNILDC